MRWAKGYLQVFRKYGLRLVRGMFGKNAFSCFDMSMNIIPAMVLSIGSIVFNAAALAVAFLRGLPLAVPAISAPAIPVQRQRSVYNPGRDHRLHAMEAHSYDRRAEAPVDRDVPRVHVHLSADHRRGVLPQGRVAPHPPRRQNGPSFPLAENDDRLIACRTIPFSSPICYNIP